jgi:hypothetical protein
MRKLSNSITRRVAGLVAFFKQADWRAVRFYHRALREAEPDRGLRDTISRMSREWLTRRRR